MTNIIRNGFVGTVIGAVFAVIVFLIGDAMSGPLEVTPPGQSLRAVNVATVIGAVITGGVVGTILAAIASFLPRPRQIFRIACLVGLVGYAIPPFVQSELFSTGVWLNVMHIGAAVPIVGRLSPVLAERKGEPVPSD